MPPLCDLRSRSGQNQGRDPPDHIDAMLRAIVGIEVQVTRVEAKAKLSQNRSEEDRQGAIEGLLGDGDPRSTAVAAAMEGIDV